MQNKVFVLSYVLLLIAIVCKYKNVQLVCTINFL